MAIINGKMGSTRNGSLNEQDDVVSCPLCMENLDIDDKSFFPCTCGYQICRFCWHRIRSESDDENGLCPACRKQYSENPANFKPLTNEDIQKIKIQKRQKDQQKKQKAENGKRHLADLRVVQKNLVFVVGISPRIADSDVLKKNEFFGKFGKIHKVVVNPCLQQGTTASAYITYIKSDDALRAIQSVNNIAFDGKTIKVSLGTTKYCSHFMRNQTCPKSECMYLHHYGDPEASFTKEDMQTGKHQEYEKKLLDEFNVNNNNEPSCLGDKKIKPSLSVQKPILVSSIQQGVSYSTKLLHNTVRDSNPDDEEEDDEEIEEDEINTVSKLLHTSAVIAEETPHPANNLIDEPEEEDDDPTPPPPIQHQEQHEDEVPVGHDSSILDLDFDPFHETQKAFEQIINEQVQETQHNSNYLGFHHQSSTSVAGCSRYTPPRESSSSGSSASYRTGDSSLLDFFSNFRSSTASSSSSILPPPPGFTPDKPRNVWSDNLDTQEHWMNLDPAIIFSKTSNDSRVKHDNFEQQNQINHLLRPTPQGGAPQYVYQNGYQQQHSYYTNQQAPAYYPGASVPRQYYIPNGSAVTPPPPGFGGLMNNNFNKNAPQPQQQLQQHQIHNGAAASSSSNNFFPF